MELLLSKDTKEASVLAEDLKELNDSRKDMTAKGVEKAVEIMENTDAERGQSIGRLSSRVSRKSGGNYCRPYSGKVYKTGFCAAKGEEGVKGSGRSIEAYHMSQGMVKCRELLSKFGGHPMAAGLSMKEENVKSFAAKLNENCTLTDEDMIEKVVIDVPMPMSYVTIPLDPPAGTC